MGRTNRMKRAWDDTIDPSTIPDEVLLAERGRRNSARVVNRSGGRNGGRPPKVYACEQCGAKSIGRTQFDAHRSTHA
jgi:hypothetical protein